MAEKKIVKEEQATEIKFSVKKGDRFSKYTFIEQSKLNTLCGKEHTRDVERTVGEWLRINMMMGWIKPVDTEKSKSRGRPATIYECQKGMLNFSCAITEGYKCEKCNYLIPMEQEDIIFCPKCGDKKEL